MCVIVVKKATDVLTKDDFQLFSRENKDGWGFVYNDETGTHAVRGMKLPALLKAYSLVQDREAVFHFRMSTHGTISEQNCHPFEVLPGLFLLHNGIFPIACTSDKTRSDTWHFSELVLKPMLAPIPNHNRADYIRSGAFRYLLETSMGSGNKVVLYDSIGPVIFNRKKWNEKAGPKKLLMSNDYPYSLASLYDPPATSLAPLYSFYDTDFPYGANKKKGSLWDEGWENEILEGAITPENFVDFLEAMSYDQLCQPEWIVDNEISSTMLEDFVSYYPAEAAKILATLKVRSFTQIISMINTKYLVRTEVRESALTLYDGPDGRIYFVREDGHEYEAPMLYFRLPDGTIRAISLLAELRAMKTGLSS